VPASAAATPRPAGPQIGSLIGAVVLFVLFAVSSQQFYSLSGISNWLDPASLFGIMAVAVARADDRRHFDLSAGVLTGTAGLATGGDDDPVGPQHLGGAAVSLALMPGRRLRQRLPGHPHRAAQLHHHPRRRSSCCRGLNLAVTKLVTGTVSVGGIAQVPVYDTVRPLFASTDLAVRRRLQIQIIWWSWSSPWGRGCCAKTGSALDVRGRRRPGRQPQRRRARRRDHITLFMVVGASPGSSARSSCEQTSVQTNQASARS
jgi:simple sugar transport system permease protein